MRPKALSCSTISDSIRSGRGGIQPMVSWANGSASGGGAKERKKKVAFFPVASKPSLPHVSTATPGAVSIFCSFCFTLLSQSQLPSLLKPGPERTLSPSLRESGHTEVLASLCSLHLRSALLLRSGANWPTVLGAIPAPGGTSFFPHKSYPVPGKLGTADENPHPRSEAPGPFCNPESQAGPFVNANWCYWECRQGCRVPAGPGRLHSGARLIGSP